MILKLEKSCDLSHDNLTIKGPVFGHREFSFELLLWFAQSWTGHPLK